MIKKVTIRSCFLPPISYDVFMNYSTLLIDADNTLFNFDLSQEKALKSTFEEIGLAYTPALHQFYETVSRRLWSDYEEGHITLGELVRRRFDALFEEFDIRADSAAFNDLYLIHLGTHATLFSGVMETLDYLYKHYQLYIVTNGIGPSQRARFDTLHLKRYFADIFISEEIGIGKPHKGFFDYVFSHIEERDKMKILIVGDSLSSDIRGGKNAGIATCWLNRQRLKNPSLKPDYEIYDITELKNIL